MKKIKILLISLISMFAFNTSVYAASSSISVSSGNVYVGDSFTVSLYVTSSAAWNVHVTASGPVNGCTIHKADASDDALDTNRSFSATCTATGEGTIVIRLSGDVTSASDGNAVSVSGSRSVSVSQLNPSPPKTQKIIIIKQIITIINKIVLKMMVTINLKIIILRIYQLMVII